MILHTSNKTVTTTTNSSSNIRQSIVLKLQNKSSRILSNYQPQLSRLISTQNENKRRFIKFGRKTAILSLSAVVFSTINYKYIRNRIGNEKDEIVIPAKDWEVNCYRLIPLRILSRSWGWCMSQEIPIAIRPHIYTWYAKAFGCNLNEIETEDLSAYKCFGEFFTRRLKPDARPIHTTHCLVSPADGQILELGEISTENIKNVKGISYSLKSFLGEPSWRNEQLNTNDYSNQLLYNKGTKLYHCVIYLAPGDYHRFHSPVDWNINFRRHFQGELLSVNPLLARWIPDLFSLNERVSYIGKWKYGFFSMTAVGATNVGSIQVYCDPNLKTNQREWKCITHEDRLINNISIKKGELFGEFKMGSTIVIVFEAPNDFNFKSDIFKQKINVGESLSKL